MKELNELVELAKEFDASNTVEAAMAIKSQFKAAATPENILAIAEAFRALEQENILLKQGHETHPLVHEMLEWKERAEAAEARLVELEHKSDALCDRKYIAGLQAGFVLGDRGDNDGLMRGVEAYLKQIILSKDTAPAVSVAELVPDEMSDEDVRGHLRMSVHSDGPVCRIEHAENVGAIMWNECRAATLRNIEGLLEVTKSALEWIDAVPSATELPAMPGFDRDWANSVIRKIEESQ